MEAEIAWGTSSSGEVVGWFSVCVYGFCECVLLCKPGRAAYSGQPTSHLHGSSPQTVARWLSALFSLSPEGSAFDTSLGPHLPLLFMLSCSGML